MKTVSVRLQDEVYIKFRKHLLERAVANGLDINMDNYIRQLIINDMEKQTNIQSKKEVTPIVESNKGLSIADLDW